TFPARKDARFGMSLAQPMYLELWELGLGDLRELGRPDEELENWLAALYATPAPAAWPFESYLHEVGAEVVARTNRRRSDLSWWSLLRMQPEEHGSATGWQPPSALLERQGLAVFRRGDRYASLECGPSGGGHGHPDRLNLTLFSDGVYWLPDFGTGSYVSRDLFWYRSTLAHNAPLLDGRSQDPSDAECEAFDVVGDWAWVQGRFGPISRTGITGPDYLLDRLEFTSGEDHLLELPWHLAGEVTVEPAGTWVPDEPIGQFAHDVERLERSDGPLTLTARVGDASLRLRVLFDGELLRAIAPGAPGSGEQGVFYLLRLRGRNLRIVTVLDVSGSVTDLAVSGEELAVTTTSGIDRHLLAGEGWNVEHGGQTIQLRGTRTARPDFEPFVTAIRPLETKGQAPWIPEAPALDGTLDGFNVTSPLLLDHEDQYRRSEEPYTGPDEFSATAWANWHGDSLYLAIEVSKPDVVFRSGSAAPLLLDNEPDDIHSDGLQVYLQPADGPALGYLIVPEEGGGLRVRAVSDSAADASQVTGAWQETEQGYRVTISLPLIEPPVGHGAHMVGFDLIVNEMLPDRQRRSGQLVWSGGGGWVWLRGDRQAPDQFGQLELV
ncbi:MAG TPA: heparinase II/III family protein, partial [Gemmatimonadales bacterium]|nr:heparinase II/III family protein [Gemmatimonadales bacterium]